MIQSLVLAATALLCLVASAMPSRAGHERSTPPTDYTFSVATAICS